MNCPTTEARSISHVRENRTRHVVPPNKGRKFNQDAPLSPTHVFKEATQKTGSCCSGFQVSPGWNYQPGIGAANKRHRPSPSLKSCLDKKVQILRASCP